MGGGEETGRKEELSYGLGIKKEKEGGGGGEIWEEVSMKRVA